MGELQMTPIMPLREDLKVGEVYRYMFKPPTFYEDGQLEPPTAFRLFEPNESNGAKIRTGKCEFPELTLVEARKWGLGVVVPPLTTLSNEYAGGSTKDWRIKVTGAYYETVDLKSITDQFVNTNEVVDFKNDQLTLKPELVPIVERLGKFNWQPRIYPYERWVMWLRIPVQVYYATGVVATVTHTANHNANVTVPVESVLVNGSYNPTNSITATMTNRFEKPLAIGYRALLARLEKKKLKPSDIEEQWEVRFFLESTEKRPLYKQFLYFDWFRNDV